MSPKLHHGHAVQNANTPTYVTWRNMISRCHNRNHPRWPDYGGRGITVCDRWRKFENFLTDMGERSPGMTIERVDNRKNYEKSNCIWASYREQNNNRRDNRLITYRGETLTIAQWSRKCGFTSKVIYDRIRYGWPIERLFIPLITSRKGIGRRKCEAL